MFLEFKINDRRRLLGLDLIAFDSPRSVRWHASSLDLKNCYRTLLVGTEQLRETLKLRHRQSKIVYIRLLETNSQSNSRGNFQ